jgi:hypothetical protein
MTVKRRAMKRRQFVRFLTSLSAGNTAFGNAVLAQADGEKRVTRGMVIQAEELAGLKFTDAQRALLIPNLDNYLLGIQRIRELSIPPEVAPAIYFISDTRGVWMLNRSKPGES